MTTINTPIGVIGPTPQYIPDVELVRLCVRVKDLRELDVIALTKVSFPRTVTGVRVAEDCMVISTDSGSRGIWFSDDPGSAIDLVGGPRFTTLYAKSLSCWKCSDLYVPDPSDQFPTVCARCVPAENVGGR
jgi:hypothetical protein